jgi:hypothetical protein
MYMKRIIRICSLVLIIIVFNSSYKLQEKKEYLKFLYLKEGESNDAVYYPCVAINSLWHEASLKTLVTFDKKDIEKFNKCLLEKRHDEKFTFMNFSNALIFKTGDITDTIYFDRQFKYFSKNQKIQGSRLENSDIKCYSFGEKMEIFLPIIFIKQYKKDNKNRGRMR